MLLWQIFDKALWGDVPDHLRDAHYAGAKELNRGIGYQYPHNLKTVGSISNTYLTN